MLFIKLVLLGLLKPLIKTFITKKGHFLLSNQKLKLGRFVKTHLQTLITPPNVVKNRNRAL